MRPTAASSKCSTDCRSTRSYDVTMLELGLVGCGEVVHRNYAKALVGRSEYSVRYVHDVDPLQAASAARLFGAETTTLANLIDAANAVIITTPPSSHAALIRQCIRPGRTLLCEKPYTTTYAAAVDLASAASAIGASLYVGHFRRAFPQVSLARRLVTLGVIGEITKFAAIEGGRFSWPAVSKYTTTDVAGGVLWDTGSHTLDMALFAAALDEWTPDNVTVLSAERDKPEPSHTFLSDFVLSTNERTVSGRLHLSRREALPNLIRIVGSGGELAFTAGLDNKVRLTTSKGTLVLTADRFHEDLLECFDLQLRRVFLKDGDADFTAGRFLGQVKLLEALAHA